MNGFSDSEDLDPFFDPVDDVMIIAVAADPETWLPQVVVGVPVEQADGDDPDSPITFSTESYIPVTLSPEEALQIGAYLIQAATVVSSYYVELIDKSIEERREIIELESQLLNSSFPL